MADDQDWRYPWLDDATGMRSKPDGRLAEPVQIFDDPFREARRVKQDRLTRIARAVGWIVGAGTAVVFGLMMIVVVLLLVWAAEALIHVL